MSDPTEEHYFYISGLDDSPEDEPDWDEIEFEDEREEYLKEREGDEREAD